VLFSDQSFIFEKKKYGQNKPLSSSASGRWNLFVHAHQGMMDVSNTIGSSLLDDSGLLSSHFLLLASEMIIQGDPLKIK